MNYVATMNLMYVDSIFIRNINTSECLVQKFRVRLWRPKDLASNRLNIDSQGVRDCARYYLTTWCSILSVWA
jgi:hypothetical protein